MAKEANRVHGTNCNAGCYASTRNGKAEKRKIGGLLMRTDWVDDGLNGDHDGKLSRTSNGFCRIRQRSTMRPLGGH